VIRRPMRRLARSGAVLTVTSLNGPFLAVILSSINGLIVKCGEVNGVDNVSDMVRPSCSVFPEQKVEQCPKEVILTVQST
jgi:hypothetical protein